MVAVLVELEGVQVVIGVLVLEASPDDESVILTWTDTMDVVFGDDAPVNPISATMGFSVFRNGDQTEFIWNDEQLNSISLPTATSDAGIAVGTMTVPGDPGWLAGDRITFRDDLGNILYTGYVMDWSRERNRASPSEVQCTYQLMDVNRQLIGRRVMDWLRPEETSLARLQAWIDEFMPDTGPNAISLDLSYIYGFGGVILPPKSYTGDGIMDLLADLILYTGHTVFLTVSQTAENTFEFHSHQPAVPLTQAGLVVSDVVADIDEVDVFGLTEPVVSNSAADMKNDVRGRNGTEEYGYANTTSITRHNAGGLLFEAVVSYVVDFPDLVVLVNNILNPITGAGEEKPTYSFSIQHLRGSDLVRVPVGSAILIYSDVLDVHDVRLPITHETLTVSRDKAGNPLPGYWDVALEVASALRQPAAVRGYGGQGGSLGALAEQFSIADHIDVVYADLSAVPVGESTLVTGYLRDEFGGIVTNGDVPVTWTLEQWQDEAETVPSTAWSLTESTSLTDRFGVALNILSHDNDGDYVKVRPKASL